MIIKDSNSSIPLICMLSFHFLSCQTCSFVLGFIPVIKEPECLLSGLVHADCSQGRGCLASLALNDFLCGQVEGGQDWNHEEMLQTPKVLQSDGVALTSPAERRTSGLCLKPLQHSRHHSVHDTAVYAHVEKRSPPGSRGTALDHLITMVLRQGHDECDYNLHPCNADMLTYLLEQPVGLFPILPSWLSKLLSHWHELHVYFTSGVCESNFDDAEGGTARQQKRVNVGSASLSQLIKPYLRWRCAALKMSFSLHHSLL